MIPALQVLLALLLPVAVVWAEPRLKLIATLSPVVVCYLLGIALGNQPLLAFDNDLALLMCSITVALAIPFLLFSVDLAGWLRLARTTVLSFFLVMISACLAAAAGHLLFGGQVLESAGIAGMLVGVYIGGTPNMAAVGTAMAVQPETFILLNAADMVASFAYLMLVLTVARPLLKRFLPPFPGPRGSELPETSEVGGFRLPPVRDFAIAFALAAAMLGLAVALGAMLPPNIRDAAIILAITSMAVLAATRQPVRRLAGTHAVGQFLLLVFCVAMGMTTDFGELFTGGPTIMAYVAFVLFASVAIHLVLATVARIDVDTAIITSVAGIFGPHLVGPVALALKNREIVFSGIASGLVGYAAGNYLGIFIAWLLGG
jgi:uncharacterized membrane protein